MVKKRLTYKVQRGDDYTKIADKLYGDKRYRTALKRQNPKVKKPRPGMVIDLLDDDPKEMWKKRERGRRRKTNLMRKDWESVKKKYGINPDLSDIEPITYTIQPQQPPPPEEPTPWWEDPTFQEGLIGLVESTAESMGLDANVMLDELGLSEDSPLLAETPTTGQVQPQTGSPSSTTTMTDEQKKALKKELGKMGLDEEVAMYELGLSDRDPYAWETPQVPTQSSGATGGKTLDDTKDGPGSTIAETAQPEELKPPETPKDLVNLLDDVKNEEEMKQWKEMLSTMNFSPEILQRLDYMASKKERELEKEMLAYNPWDYYPEEVVKRVKGELSEDWVAEIKDKFTDYWEDEIIDINVGLRCLVLTSIGKLPDYRGIAIAEAYVPKGGEIEGIDATAVAAGIAIQSQNYYKGKDTKEGYAYILKNFIYSSSSGFGIAQITDDEMSKFGFEGVDQEDPEVSIQAMAIRIKKAVNACKDSFEDYTPQDLLITAALAQNGKGFNADEIKITMVERFTEDIDDSPDWKAYFGARGRPGEIWAKVHQKVIGKQYDTQFMLKLYINDLRELHDRGWELPFGLTEQDLDEVEDTYYTKLKLDNL